MLLGKVSGTVVSTRKEHLLDGLTLLLIEHCLPNGKGQGTFLVATDSVSAGIGEIVLYTTGSSARQTELTTGKPIDATVMAIVDSIDMGGSTEYLKDS